DSEVKVTASASISINDMISITPINAMPRSPASDNCLLKYLSLVRIIASNLESILSKAWLRKHSFAQRRKEPQSPRRRHSRLTLWPLVQAFTKARQLTYSPGLMLVTVTTECS